MALIKFHLLLKNFCQNEMDKRLAVISQH